MRTIKHWKKIVQWGCVFSIAWTDKDLWKLILSHSWSCFEQEVGVEISWGPFQPELSCCNMNILWSNEFKKQWANKLTDEQQSIYVLCLSFPLTSCCRVNRTRHESISCSDSAWSLGFNRREEEFALSWWIVHRNSWKVYASFNLLSLLGFQQGCERDGWKGAWSSYTSISLLDFSLCEGN